MLCGMLSPVYSFEWFDGADEVLTNDTKNVVWSDIRNAKSGLRWWTQLIGRWVGDADSGDKIYYEELDNTWDSRAATANYVRALVNYALAVLWLVALLYILYHWFLTVTATWDDDQAAKWWKWIKYWSLALVWVGLAWFVVSIIVWIVQQAAA